MAMTRKDYAAIAEAIKQCAEGSRFPGNLFMDAAAKQAIRRMVYRLAATFCSENPRFDRTKFENACGVEAFVNDDAELSHLRHPDNLEEHARDTSKQKRRSNLAKV